MENRKEIWLISPEEAALTHRCLEMSMDKGADHARVNLSKSMQDSCSMLNGEVDKVSHSGDRVLTFNLFADGRYGSFSTNRLDSAALDIFIGKAVDMVRTLAPDEFRKLPDSSRTAKDAVTGMEAGVFDRAYEETDADKRLDLARAAAFYGKDKEHDIISEEVEYSDSISDEYIIDSEGLGCRHSETSFEIGCETTLSDGEGGKVSGFWWDSSPFLDKLGKGDGCGRKAAERAAAQKGARNMSSGRYNAVVENETASRLLSPVLNALNAFSIQQKNSFLAESLGKRLFPEGFTIMDLPRVKGACGAKLFDSEGVATRNCPVVEDGVVKEYFVNTYMAEKMGIAPTVEDVTRACVLPFLKNGNAPGTFGARELMELVGDGIYVCGLNGGNCNSATGDFSYGIEGFAFKNGRIAHPVRGMIMTGNMLSLWASLIGAGTDCRGCMSRQVPSMAFGAVDFSS